MVVMVAAAVVEEGVVGDAGAVVVKGRKGVCILQILGGV